jgi:hypothetical protein
MSGRYLSAAPQGCEICGKHPAWDFPWTGVFCAACASPKKNARKRRPVGAHSTGSAYQAAEVAWYRKHGKHPQRIQRMYGGEGDEYVVGDWSWHRMHSDSTEWIDARMAHALASPNDQLRNGDGIAGSQPASTP